ncbi:hypothetical protein [Rhizobium laguerreae]|uniref:hypothetical protein n=1 Tax=Rhizobium laguerreae TaxID=1076926 RepID=UPI001FEDD30D|nr:hypothetical protein [Rhizobium laguerreae]
MFTAASLARGFPARLAPQPFEAVFTPRAPTGIEDGSRPSFRNGVWHECVVAALIAGPVVGLVVERGVLRFFAGRYPVVLLVVTYALFLILEDVVKLIWGVDPWIASDPVWAFGKSISDPCLPDLQSHYRRRGDHQWWSPHVVSAIHCQGQDGARRHP